MSLNGYVDIEIENKDDASNPEELRISGKEFSWEEGGEHDSSFLFIYFDTEDRFRILVEFSTEENRLFNWSIGIRDASVNVEIIEDALEVPDRFFNYDPEDF